MRYKKKNFFTGVFVIFLLGIISACGDQNSDSLSASGIKKIDIGEDMFLQASDAEQRSVAIGCDGTHEHLINGELWHMPCGNHSDYIRQTGETHDHDHDHDHDHGSSEIMLPFSPDIADVLISIEFINGAVITEETRVSVSIGDLIVFAAKSDIDEYVHIHGIDLLGEVSSSIPVNYFGFKAEVSGIFEVEFENSGTFIAEIMAS